MVIEHISFYYIVIIVYAILVEFLLSRLFLEHAIELYEFAVAVNFLGRLCTLYQHKSYQFSPLESDSRVVVVEFTKLGIMSQRANSHSKYSIVSIF